MHLEVRNHAFNVTIFFIITFCSSFNFSLFSGFVGGKVFKRHRQQAAEIELSNLSKKGSVSLPDLTNTEEAPSNTGNKNA